MSRLYILCAMLCCWGCARPREQVLQNSVSAKDERREKLVGTNIAPRPNEWFLGDSTNIAPLSDDWLLGASSLAERDEICEAVVRWIAMTQTNACYFVGFENVVNKPIGQDGDDYLDLTPKLRARLGDWAPVVEPLSAAKWDPIEAWIAEESRNVVVGYEVSRKGVRCTIWGITLGSKDEAEVHVRFMSHKAMGSELWRFHLRHENSAWRVLDGGPKARFG